ncbi:MAG: hypothetical protein DK303_000569 [Chloroflexi bacterium]|jgi:hypothetical protein|nr:MAG: hypothetical protein DK303_000569 [Chloroflexota bacterium]
MGNITNGAITCFTGFETLYGLIQSELEGLTEEQLDYTSQDWEWARWSIRNQVSHMASLIPRWLVLRWGSILFPLEDHGVKNIEEISQSKSDRRLDDGIYWEINDISLMLKKFIDLAIRVLNDNSLEFMASQKINRDTTLQWEMMAKAHPNGVTSEGKPAKSSMTLEATMRHIYFEELTHLYNIQRLKKAQGLTPKVVVPNVGYWTLDGWDRSQP